MLRKLGNCPRQNGLAIALRELGRIERTLFILHLLQSVELRRRVHARLNKGEARNALAGAVFIHRLGEIRDRSFEQQRYRASGLNLVTGVIVLWNSVYPERATQLCASQASCEGRDAAIFVALGLGTHQSDWGLRLASESEPQWTFRPLGFHNNE
jgi:TnpA family transposase